MPKQNPGPDAAVAVAEGAGGGWNTRLFDNNGAPLIDEPLGGRVTLRSVGRVAMAFLRRRSVGGVVVENEKFGNVVAGRSPNGYAQPFRNAPGGAVIIPYVVDPARGEVLIGQLTVTRGLVGNGAAPVSEIPRGFVATDEGERHEDAARRETVEETGLAASVAARAHELPGELVNADSAFFVSDAATGRGVRMYALELAPTEVVYDARTGSASVAPNLFEGIREVNEKIDPAGLRFVPIQRAMLTGDNFSRGAAGALWGELAAQGRVGVVTPQAGAREIA